MQGCGGAAQAEVSRAVLGSGKMGREVVMPTRALVLSYGAKTEEMARRVNHLLNKLGSKSPPIARGDTGTEFPEAHGAATLVSL